MFSLIHSLEPRMLFAGGASPHITFDTPDLSQLELRDGVLIVNGTHKDDRITITRINKGDFESQIGARALSGVMGPTEGRSVKSAFIAASTVVPPRLALGATRNDWKNFATIHSENLGDLTAVTTSTSGLLIKTARNAYMVDATLVKSIQVNGAAGNDTIRLGKKVGIPTTVLGGNGDDLLEAGSKIDVLNGGAGADTLVAAGEGSIIGNYIGGTGTDRMQNFVFSDATIPLSWFKSNGVEGIVLAQGGRFTTS